MSRIRTRYGPQITIGTVDVWTGSIWKTVQTTSSYDTYEYCADTVGFPTLNNSLLITKRDLFSTRINGQNSSYRITNRPIPVSNIDVNTEPGWSANQAALQLKANTNPSRPSVSLPLAVFELRNVPRQLYNEGQAVINRANKAWRRMHPRSKNGYADLNLAIQFGLLPLISDIKKLMSFDSNLERRTNEINRLYEKGGLRRRMKLGSYTSTVEGTLETINSYPGPLYIRGIPTTVTESQVWGTIRWKPTASFAVLSDAERRKKTQDILLGLDGSQIAQNIWNALPWSWLIDWASNVGTFLQANNNRVAYTFGSIPIMRQSTSTKTWKVTVLPSWATLSPASPVIVKTQKERFVAIPSSLSATVPFLTGRQLSILGSLAIIRSRSRH